jgi:hypothetical protein
MARGEASGLPLALLVSPGRPTKGQGDMAMGEGAAEGRALVAEVGRELRPTAAAPSGVAQGLPTRLWRTYCGGGKQIARDAMLS